MYMSEFKKETVLKALELLKAQEGVCEVSPSVIFNSHNGSYCESVNLLCNHTNPSLNCGQSAAGCKRCLDKDSFLQASNRNYQEMLKQTLAGVFALQTLGVET